ncbi:Dual specificity mitogen-activated kinase kinase jkk-1 [Hyphodiscus hymeniophilus]|uniref:mitogen-activated protein kinase kinase n=1 Tax=Hyphodiscus hymeniophilus TaxID=353542 RepID=A0A9P6SQ83_9HELO|nr:Dual specificity mitogen-activated kinase kinase jkk-1 [Hyphodiscus hymeniophilus]
MGYVTEWKGSALKYNAMQRGFDSMMIAQDCAVRPVGRIMRKIQGRAVMTGLLTELLTPFDVTSIAPAEKPEIKREMIRLVSTLHEKYRMAHGDIKPSNFLRCKDGSLRLCDFDTARLVDDEEADYEGCATLQFLAPNRHYFATGAPPTAADDIYALGLSIWSLFTGKKVLVGVDLEELLQQRGTVELDEIDDMETRWLVRICL